MCIAVSITHVTRNCAQNNRRLSVVGGPIPLRDGARPHVSIDSMEKINALGWEVLPHLAYLLDLAPSNFHMFRHLYHFVRRKWFANQNAVIHGVSDFLDYYDAGFCHRDIFALEIRWAQCIAAEGGYFA